MTTDETSAAPPGDAPGETPEATVDALLAATVADDGAPGVAWGVVAGGRLVHAGGAGTVDATRPGAGAPGPRTLFRIASMTKSFTAAVVMALRDEGALRLDDPVATHVPEAAALRPPTDDAPAVTVRDLLCMRGGLPSDDPWADRHLDLADADLLAAVAIGPWFASTTGTTFTYSNLGYALLGQVVRNVTGRSCQDEVTSRFVEPLGLRHTVWAPRPDHTDIAVGHRRVGGAWVRDEPGPLGDGAIAPMGGLWSTVADLARWAAFFLDAFPARDGDDAGPLRRATRREMQRAWNPTGLVIGPCAVCATPRALADGYAAGLRVHDDAHVGHVVMHSGGLPGFGSNMRWTPERDLGLVSLGNATYAPMAARNREAFDALAHRGQLPPPRSRPVPAELAAAAEALVALLNEWDDAAADALFADNVALDEPYDRRRRDAAELRAATGRLRVTEVRAEDRADATVTVAGERAEATVELQLHPLRPPRVQWYEATVVPRTPG